MIDERHEALMHEVMDGEAGPGGAAELEQFLRENPEARSYFQDLNRLGQILHRVKPIDPPPHIKHQVMRSIAAQPVETPVERGSWRDMFARIWRGDNRRLAYSFATGIAMGALGFALLGDTTSMRGFENGLTGAMISGKDLSNAVTIDAARVDLDGVVGTLETKVVDHLVVVEINLRSEVEVEVMGLRAQGPNDFLGVRREDNGAGFIAAGPDGWRITHSGRNRYLVLLGPDSQVAPTLVVQVRAEGVSLERSLRSRPEGS